MRRAVLAAAGGALVEGPPAYSAPLTITTGGTYSGAWESLNPAVAAVTVNTTAAVTIQNSYFRSRGICVRAGVNNANIVVQNSRGYGLNPAVAGTAPGRFFKAEQFNRVHLLNNHMEGTSGVYLLNKAGTGSETDAVKILRNNVVNVDGRWSTGAGYTTSNSNVDYVQFVQLDKIVAGGIEIAWNKMVNTPGQSRTEDLISIYESRGTSTNKLLIHNNYLFGSYPVNPGTDSFSGGGIITDGSSNTSIAWVEAYNNQVIATINYGIAISAGNNVYMHDNRVVCAGELPDGTDIAATNVGAYVWNIHGGAGFTSNNINLNTIGWYKRNTSSRNDLYDPDCMAGGCGANTSLHAGAITVADEQAELAIWNAKVASNAVTIGPV